MMKKVLLYGLIASLVGAVFLFAGSTNYLKKPFSPHEDMAFYLSQMEGQVAGKDFGRAKESLKKANQAWNHVRKRIQYMGEEDDIKRIDQAFFNLKVLLDLEDADEIRQEMSALSFSWYHVGK